MRLAAGDLAKQCSQLEAAEVHYQAAEILYRGIPDLLGLANTLRSMGDLEQRKGHDESARAFYREADPIYERIHEGTGDAVGWTNLMAEVAELVIKAGRADDAIAGIRRGLPLALQYENRYAINKFSEMLNSLGIDPDAFLSGRS